MDQLKQGYDKFFLNASFFFKEDCNIKSVVIC